MWFFDTFRLTDLFDILIIAFFLYQAYSLLINSRAWNVVRGLGLLLAVWFLATQLDLQATEWLFNRVAPVGFIGLVVVFQPELRAALERVGRGRLGRETDQDPVQEIMSAVRDLASQRRGALLCIQGRTPLAEYGANGTVLNAPVTSALLQTIFASAGPLHDGAVLIVDDLVSHAGAILPLSDRQEGWSVKHGTRHRAGLGLAEVSDALVLIISEERGTVSLARNGELDTDVAPADVLVALKEAYQ
ncbi:MAG TPA: diadenylate cyclase CdaA [Deinococcales bacterium]|nr:diadenylate cyclase CdaA [Deinococcales bacterium]